MKRLVNQAKIGDMLHRFQGLKNIAGVKSIKKRKLITHVSDKNGREHTDRQQIANVFADFYEDLYQRRGDPATTDELWCELVFEGVRAITVSELRIELKAMHCKKAPKIFKTRKAPRKH